MEMQPASQPHGYPPASQGGQEYPPPSGQGYPPPSGQGYPPPSGQGYPPLSGQGYPPPSGQGYPPPSGQGYPPPSGQGYPPPSGQGYPPGGQGYPPSGQGYPPGGQGHNYPPSAGQGHSPSNQGPSASVPSNPTNAPQGAAGDENTMQPFEPPPGFLDNIPGYDSITFDDIPLLPPKVDDGSRGVEPKNRTPFAEAKAISQEEAKAALEEYVNSNCCYGKAAAQEMAISNMTATTAFRYTLETFTEMRATAWAQVPFTGNEPLDTAMNGQPPQPWDVPIMAKEKFKTEKRQMEVPHTASVKPCHKCQGSGTVVCATCHGQGTMQCSNCSGKGSQTVGGETHPCTFCNGSGRRDKCGTCSGTGRAKCAQCKGYRQLKWFVQLTVTWTNHVLEFIPERTSLPDAEVKKATGQVAFEEENPWLYPVNHAPDPSIIKASAELIEKQKKAFPNERQLLQRQKIYIIPVTQATCHWKESPFSFFVFGLENRVYSSDYPQKWCCGCTIL